MELVAVCFFVVFLGLATSTVQRNLRRIEVSHRLTRLRVDVITRRLGLDPTEPYLQHIEQLLAQERKLEAIKVYRDYTAASSVEAKEAIEHHAWLPRSDTQA